MLDLGTSRSVGRNAVQGDEGLGLVGGTPSLEGFVVPHVDDGQRGVRTEE